MYACHTAVHAHPKEPNRTRTKPKTKQRRELGLAQDLGDKASYDAMLHSDTRFWNEIAARKRRAAARARKEREMERLRAQQKTEPGQGQPRPPPQQQQQPPVQPAFSILEEGAGGVGDGEEGEGEGEGESLVVFDATPSAALPTPTLPPFAAMQR